MGDGQLPLGEQLRCFYRGMQSRMTQVDTEMLKRAESQVTANGAERALARLGDQAPDFSLTDQNGASVRLADRLALGPVVLLFSRGAWCPFCTMLLRAWQDALPRLHDAGGDLVAILPQRIEECGQAAERDLLAFPVLSDPGGNVAESYGVNIDLPEVAQSLHLRLGHDLPRINGTGTWRVPLSSAFVIAPDGTIAVAHVDMTLPTCLEPDAAIQAVRRMAGS